MPTNGVGTHKDWRDLADQASKETDPVKLQELVTALCEALDQATPQRAKSISRKSDIPVDE